MSFLSSSYSFDLIIRSLFTNRAFWMYVSGYHTIAANRPSTVLGYEWIELMMQFCFLHYILLCVCCSIFWFFFIYNYILSMLTCLVSSHSLLLTCPSLIVCFVLIHHAFQMYIDLCVFYYLEVLYISLCTCKLSSLSNFSKLL